MSKRILVVEDLPDNRQIIRDMLAPTDYEITEAENGEEALAAICKAAARSRPDGYPTADHGRLHGHAPDQGRSYAASDPDIAVTSYVEDEKARAAGCDEYVPEPYSPRQLLAKIRQYLSY
jgi:two-component system, cell cycle response regulator DivK